MLRKALIILIMLGFIISCSSGQERFKLANKLGEVIYQKNPKGLGTDDVLVVKIRDGKLVIVFISANGSITGVSDLFG